MRSVKEILRSPRLMREVSVLLFGFAAINALVGVLLMTVVNSQPEVLEVAVGSLFQAFVYAVLGFFIRREAIVALWIAGILFVIDTAFLLTVATGKGLGAAVVTRGILVFALVRYIKRERVRE